MDDRLYRSRTDRMLAGVAGGLAERLDVDPSLVRVVWAVSMPLTGFLTLLIYIVMALVVPDEPWPMGPTPFAASSAPTEPDPGAGRSAATDPRPTSGAAGATTGAAGADPAMASSGGAASGAGPAGWPSAAWAHDQRAQRFAERSQRRAARAAWRAEHGPGAGPVVIGLVLVALGLLFLAPQVIPAFDWGLAWPIVVIVIGLLLIVGSFRRS